MDNHPIAVIGMINNHKLSRWHPIVFVINPLPGGYDPTQSGCRYKSKFHHTAGFATREEALTEARGRLKEKVETEFGPAKECLEKDFPWDGEEIPAMVVWFDKDANYLF